MLEKPDTARPFRARFFLPYKSCIVLCIPYPACTSGIRPETKAGNPQEKTVTVVFYNTENFYDTLDDPHKNDNEFLPLSDLHWDSQKYLKKVRDIARVLASVDSLSLPGVIGLAEVENTGVLKDLCRDPSLKCRQL